MNLAQWISEYKTQAVRMLYSVSTYYVIGSLNLAIALTCSNHLKIRHVQHFSSIGLGDPQKPCIPCKFDKENQ